jgi:thiol-disulfide isomerase/thioredoxin
MQKRTWVWPLLAVMVLMGVLAGCALRSMTSPAVGFTPSPSTTDTSTKGEASPNHVGIEKGFMAPDFQALTMQGESISLSQWRGSFVVLNFWAIWCEPCKDEIPELNAFYQAHKGKVRMIGIEVDSARSEVASFLQVTPLAYPVILDSESRDALSRLFSIRSIPATFLIDENGVIVEKIVGSTTQSRMESFLK